MKKRGLPVRKNEEHYTYQDYRQWPDDERWELIDGVAFNMCAAPTTGHQNIAFELGRKIADFLEGKECVAFPCPSMYSSSG